jgi:putative membrane protein
VGAAYGALAEYYPAATAREGASFGMTLEALTHETALPALGISAEPEDETMRERASEITSHVVYGVTTEFVRNFVRKVL